MDWLNRARQFVGNILGGAGRTISNIAGGVARGVGQAEQQAARVAQQAVQNVQRNIPQAPPIQLPRVNIQMPRIQLPQAPKIDFAAVGKALSDYYGKTALSQTGKGMENAIKSIGPNFEAYNQTFFGGGGRNLMNLGTALNKYNLPVFLANQLSGGQLYKNIDLLNAQSKQAFFPEAGTKNSLSPTSLSQYTPTMKLARTGGSISKELATQGALLALTGGLGNAAAESVPGVGLISQVGKTVLPGSISAGSYSGLSAALEGKSGKDIAKSAAGGALAGGLTSGLIPFIPNVGKIPVIKALPRALASSALGYATAPLAGMSPEQGALLGLAGGTFKPYELGSLRPGQTLPNMPGIKFNLPTDKNAPITVGSLPEKGALRAQGYTNVKVQFQPKPGQVAPTMQGAVAENVYPRQIGGKFGPAPKAPVAATADYQALQQTARDAQDNLIKMRQSGQFTEAQMKPYADNVNKLNQQMVDMRTGKLPTIYENVPKSYLEPQGKMPISKQRGFTESIRKSPEVSQDVASAVSGEYTPKANQLLVDKAVKFSNNINKATENIKSELNNMPKNTLISDQTVANAILTAKKHDAMGNFEQATEIYDKLSEKLTEAGRTVQAASLLQRQTPEGLQYSARQLFKKAGIEITPEIQKQIQMGIEAIKATPMGSEARSFAIAKMQKELFKYIPNKALDNVISLWKGGLLSGFKTQAGNLLSNTTFGALKLTSNPVSALADSLLSVFTNKRSYTLTGKGLTTGGLEGFKKGAITMRTGIDMRDITGKVSKFEVPREINFKNKALQTILGNPTNLVFRGMSAADQPVYFAALKNSLYNQAKAEGINQGLKGQALNQFIKKSVFEPSNNIAEIAVKDAEKAVLGSDNVLSKIINYANKETTNPAAKVAINSIFPFVKVPTNFLLRTTDYTPLGPIKTIINQVFIKKKFDQRALAQAIGEGVTGTGLLAIGAALASQNLLSGEYPKNDQKEQARWKVEGIQPNSVKLGDKWVSLNYLGPIGLLFNASKNFVDTAKSGGDNFEIFSQTVGGFGTGLLQQSFLQGLSGFINAANDPGRYLSNYLKGQVGSIVPAWINDLANISDNMQRQTNTIIQQAMVRIPGLRQTLPVKTDVFGNPLTQASGSGVETALNPFKPSLEKQTTLTNELDRLKAVDKTYDVWPTPVDQKDFFGKGTNITKEQMQQIQADLGQQLQDKWNQVIQSPAYQLADDKEKAKMLSKAKEDVTTQFKISSAKDYGQTYTGKAPSKTTTPLEKYQAALDKYNQDKADGKISKYQEVNRLQEIQRLSIASKFTQDVTDIYALNGTEIKNLLDNKVIPQDLWNQVISYGDSLVNAGLASKNKFKDKYGNIYLPGTAPKGAKGARVRISSLKTPRLKAIKVAVPKAPKVSFKQPTPTKARKSIKIKTG